MTITIPDDKARDLLAELPVSTTAAVTDLKAKLKEGLQRNRMLSAEELAAVCQVLVKESDQNDTVLESALGKLRMLHEVQLAREQGRG